MEDQESIIAIVAAAASSRRDYVESFPQLSTVASHSKDVVNLRTAFDGREYLDEPSRVYRLK